jgi:signal transduction histidine kinase
MTLTLPQAVTALDRSRQEVDSAVRETAQSPARRAARLVEVLQALWPAPLYACWLRQGGHESWSVQAEAGTPGPPGEERLRTVLRQWTDTVGDRAVGPVELPPDLDTPGQPLLAAALAFRGRCFGVLAGILPAAEEGRQEAAAAFLAGCAQQAAAAIYAEAAAPDDGDRQAWLNNISELTAIIAHEFNNFLNGILLHVAVLKQSAPKEMAPELDVIRTLGNNAAALVKQLQKYNSKHRGPVQTVDLNQAVRDTLDERQSREPSPLLQVQLAPDVPLIQAKPRELGRLLNLLLDQAAAATAPQPGRIGVQTRRAGNRVLLRVEDAGPPIEEAQLAKVFEPFAVARPGGDEAGLSVCHTLARHMHGSMRAENRPEGGVAVSVEFSPAIRA